MKKISVNLEMTEETEIPEKYCSEDFGCEFRRMFIEDDLFLRTYGPINPGRFVEGVQLKCESSPGELCAMMTCMCLYEDERTWFNGKCDNCDLEIEAEKSAVRLPRYMGGFTGCYCSIDCARLELIDEENSVENIMLDVVEIFLKAHPINLANRFITDHFIVEDEDPL